MHSPSAPSFSTSPTIPDQAGRAAISAPWIDTHSHLNAAEFAADGEAVHQAAREVGVGVVVVPAVEVSAFDAVRTWAHRHGDGYALGIHPLYIPSLMAPDGHEVQEVQAQTAIQQLRTALLAQRQDPHLLALGEMGLDFFLPLLKQPPWREWQEWFCVQQLELARELDLPVILHLRRSADDLLKHLRRVRVRGGIVHAFNGSLQQAQAFVELGFKLGFGGALSFERAQQLRRLACELPAHALVLETDAPDMPPQWLYQNAQSRAAGTPQGRNSPAELPRIAQVLADLRGLAIEELRELNWANACCALPGLLNWPHWRREPLGPSTSTGLGALSMAFSA